MRPRIHIVPILKSDYEGDRVLLECKGNVNPMKTTGQVAHGGHMSVEWSGPEGVLLMEQNKVTVGVQENSDDGSSRTILISETNFRHSGLYSCQVTINLPNSSIVHTVSTEYHPVFLSKCIIYIIISYSLFFCKYGIYTILY